MEYSSRIIQHPIRPKAQGLEMTWGFWRGRRTGWLVGNDASQGLPLLCLIQTQVIHIALAWAGWQVFILTYKLTPHIQHRHVWPFPSRVHETLHNQFTYCHPMTYGISVYAVAARLNLCGSFSLPCKWEWERQWEWGCQWEMRKSCWEND